MRATDGHHQTAGHLVSAAMRSVAQWVLYFGVAFGLTGGFLLLAHV